MRRSSGADDEQRFRQPHALLASSSACWAWASGSSPVLLSPALLALVAPPSLRAADGVGDDALRNRDNESAHLTERSVFIADMDLGLHRPAPARGCRLHEPAELARASRPPTSGVPFGRSGPRGRQNAGIEALSVQSPCPAPPGPCLMVGLPDRAAPPVATGCDHAPRERHVKSVESRAAAVLNVPRARLGHWCVRRDSWGRSSSLRHALSPPSDPAAPLRAACPARRSQRAARVEVPTRRHAVGREELRRAQLCRLGFACSARHAPETAPS